jgi:hypothetical protein
LNYVASLLRHVNFPCAEVLDPWATGAEIKALIERCGSVFVKPVFRGDVVAKAQVAPRIWRRPLSPSSFSPAWPDAPRRSTTT